MTTPSEAQGQIEGLIRTNGRNAITATIVVAAFSIMTSLFSSYATLESPQLTGIPTAPTPISANSTTQIATTAYVKNVVANAVNATVFCDGVADTTNIQSALLNGGTIKLVGSSCLSNALTINVANTTLVINKGTTLSFPSLASNGKAFTVGVNNFSLVGGGSIVGPTSSYSAGQDGVYMVGASGSNPLIGLFVDAEISNFGSSAVLAKWVTDVQTGPNLNLHDNGYVGLNCLSCVRARVNNGIVNMLDAPGTAGNAYGIAFSHDSTNYSSDPNAGTPLAANAFSRDVELIGTTFIGPKIWQALDTHGCYNCSFKGFKIYAAKLGVSLPTGSGAASGYAGYDNNVDDYTIDERMPDGTSSGVTGNYALTLDGPSSGPTAGIQFNKRLTISNGRTYGYGITGTSDNGVYRITGSVQNVAITNVIADNWAGTVFSYGGKNSSGISITNSIIGGMKSAMVSQGGTETIGYIVSITNVDTLGKIGISGLIHNATNGNVAGVGISGSGFNPSSPAISIGANDFTSALLQYGFANHQYHGAGAPGSILKTGVSGAVTVDLTPSLLAPGIPIVVRFSGLTGNVTSVTFTNPVKNQQVIVLNDDATYTVTMTRSAAVLAGGSNWIGARYGALHLINGTAYWQELSRSNNS